MNRYTYWIWLKKALKDDIKTLYALYKVFGSAEAVYCADRHKYWGIGLQEKYIPLLLDKDLTEAHNIFGQCERFGIELLCIEDDEYPDRLREIALPPCLLFYQGDLQCIDGPTLTVIGTRFTTVTGESVAAEISHGLSASGFTIVCGVADGIERVVHKAVVGSDGRCVLLLPCGILAVDRRVSHLIRDVLPTGLVLSEWLPADRQPRAAYQIRNRILSALSLGTLVIQAPHRSGAVMTAHYALEQNKDVFVVPGGVRDPSYLGSNELLREGAVPILEANDIVKFYKPKWKDNLQETVIEDTQFESYVQSISETPDFESDDEKYVFGLITPEGRFTDEIIAESGLPASKVLVLITMMEIKGWIEPLSGGKYRTII